MATVLTMALVVLLAACGQYGAGNSTSSPTATPSGAPAAQPTPPITTERSLTVTLGPGRDADQSGTATLSAKGDQTQVVLNIKPGPAGVAQPSHIHAGTCSELGGIRYPLASVVDGKSTTMVGATLDSLQRGTFVINVHKSAAEIGVYVTCGAIPSQTAGTTPAVGSNEPY
ncbi:MAG: CHRD domain-containing protein [Chloroflexi bacterium]|nr:CHRD domain-containing protein [Chloroflexota bacterium]